VSGTVTVAEDVNDSTVVVDIDPASIDTRDAGRDEHLRTADFLDAEAFPTITYASTGLRRDGGDWVLTVRDDGRGFDTGAPRTGMGLANLQARVSAMGGTFLAASIAGDGTTVTARWPA